MDIKRIVLGEIAVNCYLVSTAAAAVVIDPGFENLRAEEFLLEGCDKQRLILLTHAHFDHIGGALRLREKTGADIVIGRCDNEYLSVPEVNLSNSFGVRLEPFCADRTVDDGDIINAGDMEIKVLHTPGHTVGGVCYLINESLFSGDTLFCGSVGRTDFPGGDFGVLSASVKRLYSLLPDETTVYPGHGEATDIGREKSYNMLVREF